MANELDGFDTTSIAWETVTIRCEIEQVLDHKISTSNLLLKVIRYAR